MPELPEVECLTRAVRLVLEGGRLVSAQFLRADLRTPIPMQAFRELLEGEVIETVSRRSKYLLIKSRKGYGVFHLGMTGNLLQHSTATPRAPHTHAVFKIVGAQGQTSFLHFVDPRRFGLIDCLAGEALADHILFANLGPEPLDCPELGAHLWALSRGRQAPIKAFIMDARTVVGVGNIYASESLFRAGINPQRKARAISRARYLRLALAIKTTLTEAIKAGGTTFRDFKTPDGNPGYFAVSLNVYDREGQPCAQCGTAIRQIRQSGRSTFYCPFCQS